MDATGDRIGARPTALWSSATLLGRLSERARREILGLGSRLRIPGGHTLTRQGAQGHTVYLLLSGCVKVLGNQGDREPLLAIRLGGDLVGDMSVLSSKPRSATVVTCSETVVKAIAGPEFRAFLLRFPDAGIELANMLGERLRWSNERRVDVAALDPRGRIGRVLNALVETYGRPVEDGWDLGAPLTQEEIASLAGIRLATAEKALRALADAGVVRLGYRKIIVLDRAALGGAG